MIVPLLLALALILASAKFGSLLAGRLGQPAVLGELVAGLALGPSVFHIFGQPYFAAAHTIETVRELGELGVVFLMFTAGLGIHFADFVKMGKPAVLAGILGVVIPLGMGAATVLPFGYSGLQAIFLGIVLAATSVSISAQTLMELRQLRSREGLTILGAAVVDDLLAIMALSVFAALALNEGDGVWGVSWMMVRMLVFLFGAVGLSLWCLPRMARWVHQLPVSEALLSFVIISLLAFAWATDVIGGIAPITGAFLVGVAFSRSSLKEDIMRGIHALTYAFFAPIFLVSIGLVANIHSLAGAQIGLTVVICGVAILSKLTGAGLGAKLGGLTWPEAWRVGVGMTSRGEVGLIIAEIGIVTGIIAADVFTVIVVMVLTTTLATPPLLRLVFTRKELTHA